jgi:adenylate cyclase
MERPSLPPRASLIRQTEWVEKALRERPDAVWAYRTLAVAYANAGHIEKAREAVAMLLRAFPGLTISRLLDIVPFGSDYLSRYAEGLRKAGLPE